ncbi:hypothetical protein [Streptomyces flaveus]|uniref:hypothetical protein n=1 Tax=Streptomyces flaveus TaxID=66370 RepID=UPI00332FE559
MNKLHFRKAAMATVLAVGTALGGVAATGAAHADEGTAVIDGKGDTHNDWAEDTLEEGDESHAVALWQTVLVADGAYWEDDGGALHQFTKDDITGEYNMSTTSATKYWQKGKGLSETGEANTKCFSAADNNLGTESKNGSVIYKGTIDKATFKRKKVDGFNKKVYSVKFDGSYVPATY